MEVAYFWDTPPTKYKIYFESLCKLLFFLLLQSADEIINSEEVIASFLNKSPMVKFPTCGQTK